MEPFILFTFKSSVCLSAGYLLYFLLFRNETLFRVRRFILLAVVFLSLVIPLVKLQVDPAGVSLPVQRLEAAFETPAPVIASATRPFPTAGIQPMSNRPGIITILYLAGAVLQLLLISFSLLRVILLLWNSKRLSYRGYRLVLVSSDLVPFCFGRRIFLSENDFRDHSREVILHEQAHLDQMHSLDLFIAGLYVVMTWYNPISWLMRRELKQNHEFEADRKVLSKGVDESDYQLLLVRRVAGETRFQLASQFNYSNIKTRIAMMNKTKSNPAATWKVLFFIPLLALMVQVFAQKDVKHISSMQNSPGGGRYLELAPDQLKILGFELSPDGLFYKNIRHGLPGKGIMCLYFTGKTYSSSIMLHEGEEISGHSAPERFLKKEKLTSFDFYPVVVANYSGSHTLDMLAAEKDPKMKLLPVQVNMATLKLGSRSDTLVFWFKPTASLSEALYPVAKIDGYLQVCPPDPHRSK